MSTWQFIFLYLFIYIFYNNFIYYYYYYIYFFYHLVIFVVFSHWQFTNVGQLCLHWLIIMRTVAQEVPENPPMQPLATIGSFRNAGRLSQKWQLERAFCLLISCKRTSIVTTHTCQASGKPARTYLSQGISETIINVFYPFMKDM